MTFRHDHHHGHGHGHGPGWAAMAGMMARRRGGRGFGPFAGGFMGEGGFAGGGFRSGRKLGADDLQVLLLALLADKPAHGYELIKDLSERSGGFYHPSPGMIYPALTYLEELGYATVEADGAKKLYRLTDAGRAHLAEHRADADALLEQMGRIAGKMESVRRAFAGESDDDDGLPFAEFRAVRKELKRALFAMRGCSPEKARRVIDILRRTAEEIRATADA